MDIHRVGVIGAGTMGGGIATATAQHGFEVVITDISADMVDKAIEGAQSFYARAVEKGRMNAADAEAAGGRLAKSSGLDDLADCDLVIEAVFEDFDLKSEVFSKLSAVLRDDSLVATNTSCLKVGDLAHHISKPERFLGLHYFSPAQINPLVEVVRGDKTDETAMAAATAFCEATGKHPLVCKDTYGFAINRFFCPYTNAAARAMDEGLATPAQIDEVAKDRFGVAAGPFFVMNIIKPRINLNAIRNLSALGLFYTPAKSMIEVGDASDSWIVTKPDPLAADTAAKVADILLGGTFLPVLQELDEEVATPEAIDMGAELALKFGKPPCRLMDELGRDEVARLIEPLCMRYQVATPQSLARVGSFRNA